MSPRGSMQHGRRARVLAWPNRGRRIEGASDRSYPPHAPATPKASPPKEREQKDDEPRDAHDVRMSVCDRLAQREFERCDSALDRRRRDAAPRRVAHKLGEQHDLGRPLPAPPRARFGGPAPPTPRSERQLVDSSPPPPAPCPRVARSAARWRKILPTGAALEKRPPQSVAERRNRRRQGYGYPPTWPCPRPRLDFDRCVPMPHLRGEPLSAP